KRAALDGTMLRSQARPAAASPHCNSECTNAQPSACVAVIPLPPASIHFDLVYVALENPAVSADRLYGHTPFRRAPICLTSEYGGLFALAHSVGPPDMCRGSFRCGDATWAPPARGGMGQISPFGVARPNLFSKIGQRDGPRQASPACTEGLRRQAQHAIARLEPGPDRHHRGHGGGSAMGPDRLPHALRVRLGGRGPRRAGRARGP